MLGVRRLLDDFLSIDEATLEVDGVVQRRLALERGDGVAAIVRRVEDGMILLTRQFRYPTLGKGPGWLLETAAGVVEAGEDVEEALQRELVEELGYRARRLELIGRFYLSPGGSTERLSLYYAEVSERDRVGPGGGVASEGESIEVVELSATRSWPSSCVTAPSKTPRPSSLRCGC